MARRLTGWNTSPMSSTSRNTELSATCCVSAPINDGQRLVWRFRYDVQRLARSPRQPTFARRLRRRPAYWSPLFTSRTLLVPAFNRVALPDVFQRFGQRLLFYGAVAVAGVASEDELVMVALVGQ